MVKLLPWKSAFVLAQSVTHNSGLSQHLYNQFAVKPVGKLPFIDPSIRFLCLKSIERRLRSSRRNKAGQLLDLPLDCVWAIPGILKAIMDLISFTNSKIGPHLGV